MTRQKETTKSVVEISRELGTYSIDAFEFLHRGLDFTVQRLHGTPEPGSAELLEWLTHQGCGPGDLESLLAAGNLPEPIIALLDHMGGVEEAARRLNRHVDGADLCWGLRDLAVKQWGLLASTVLHHWGIRSTRDFGRMVFALVENGLLQKQPQDHIEDFDNVYDFTAAFDRTYTVTLKPRTPSEGETE